MKLEIHKPSLSRPVLTPYGILEREFSATARLNANDQFTVEVEVEVRTSDSTGVGNTGIILRKVSILADEDAPIGVSTTHLREIQLKGLLEAVIHQAALGSVGKKKIKEINLLRSPSPEQMKAAEIVFNNPGASHAKLISKELGITLQSARNLLTRTRKSGLLPNARISEPAERLPTIQEMSDEGAYIERVLMGVLPPMSPRQRRALQEVNREKGRQKNAKRRK